MSRAPVYVVAESDVRQLQVSCEVDRRAFVGVLQATFAPPRDLPKRREKKRREVLALLNTNAERSLLEDPDFACVALLHDERGSWTVEHRTDPSFAALAISERAVRQVHARERTPVQLFVFVAGDPNGFEAALKNLFQSRGAPAVHWWLSALEGGAAADLGYARELIDGGVQAVATEAATLRRWTRFFALPGALVMIAALGLAVWIGRAPQVITCPDDHTPPEPTEPCATGEGQPPCKLNEDAPDRALEQAMVILANRSMELEHPEWFATPALKVMSGDVPRESWLREILEEKNKGETLTLRTRNLVIELAAGKRSPTAKFDDTKDLAIVGIDRLFAGWVTGEDDLRFAPCLNPLVGLGLTGPNVESSRTVCQSPPADWRERLVIAVAKKVGAK